MELSDIIKGAESMRRLLPNWIQCLRHPLQFSDQQFINLKDENAKVLRAISLWTVSFVLTLLVLFPLYHVVGIGLEDREFHLSTFFILLLSVLTSGVFFHIGFLWSGIKSKLNDTLLMEAVTMSCYTPFITLTSYSVYLQIMNSINEARERHVSNADFLCMP
jgi:hypothetical protein